MYLLLFSQLFILGLLLLTIFHFILQLFSDPSFFGYPSKLVSLNEKKNERKQNFKTHFSCRMLLDMWNMVDLPSAIHKSNHTILFPAANCLQFHRQGRTSCLTPIFVLRFVLDQLAYFLCMLLHICRCSAGFRRHCFLVVIYYLWLLYYF